MNNNTREQKKTNFSFRKENYAEMIKKINASIQASIRHIMYITVATHLWKENTLDFIDRY